LGDRFNSQGRKIDFGKKDNFHALHRKRENRMEALTLRAGYFIL
jgi:hypothetical protein